jgi:hypothetical protein
MFARSFIPFRLHLPLLGFAICLPTCQSDRPVPITIHVASDAATAIHLTADDIMNGLQVMHAQPVGRTAEDIEQCEAGAVHITIGEDSSLEKESYSIQENRCDDSGKRITLKGGGLMSTQWAGYDLLRHLGVHFFHPENTFYPSSLAWPEAPFDIEESPSFQERSISVHRTHPVELSAPLSDENVDMAALQMKWIDWNVALRMSHVSGWDTEYVEDYAYLRGFPRGTGFNLLSTQQGGVPLIDPDDPRSEEEQIAEAIELRVDPGDGTKRASSFGFNFTPSEFTEADATDTVRRITFITEYLTENYPDVKVWTINHGTHQEPTEEYGVRFSSLPKLAPPELGVKVHTLMFYDLVRDAPVYGNANFNYLLDFIREESMVRRIVHYPESSWWLTFDLPVPLFLAPVTLEARQKDVDAIQDLLSPSPEDKSGVYGHRLFSSGQEWGYWLIDYCFSRMSWSTSFTHRDCIEDVSQIFSSREVFQEVWQLVEERQIEDMRNPELIRFLVGSDEETEVALDVGIVFHPLPPHPEEVLSYSDEQILALRENSLNKLTQMAADYEEWTERIEVILPEQTAMAAPYLREFRDGLIVFALRAQHAVMVYETAITLRQALSTGSLEEVNSAYEGVLASRGITDSARTIIHRREEDYRYPLELSIAGDEPGTSGAIDNKTIYPYRYLSRTHRLFYWSRPDDQLASLFGEGLSLVNPNRRLLLHEHPLNIHIVADSIFDLSIVRGDGTTQTALEPYTYENQGHYSWVLDATTTAGAIHHEDEVAVVAQRFIFPKGHLRVQEPAGAAALDGLLPGLMIGYTDSPLTQMVLGQIEDHFDLFEENIATPPLVVRDRAGQTSGPADLALQIDGVGEVLVYDAVIELVDDIPPDGKQLFVEGIMNTDEIVALLVGVGGFEENGARELIATLLDYTAETLPERINFTIFAYGKEDLSSQQ